VQQNQLVDSHPCVNVGGLGVHTVSQGVNDHARRERQSGVEELPPCIAPGEGRYWTEHPHTARSDLRGRRSEENTSELTTLMRISYAGFCMKQQNNTENYY